MRLIDADLLEPDAEYDDGEFWAYSTTQIKNAPTIEPEIVRCKDCKYYRPQYDQDDLCVYTMTSVEADDYCSYAERKEGADG